MWILLCQPCPRIEYPRISHGIPENQILIIGMRIAKNWGIICVIFGHTNDMFVNASALGWMVSLILFWCFFCLEYIILMVVGYIKFHIEITGKIYERARSIGCINNIYIYMQRCCWFHELAVGGIPVIEPTPCCYNELPWILSVRMKLNKHYVDADNSTNQLIYTYMILIYILFCLSNQMYKYTWKSKP